MSLQRPIPKTRRSASSKRTRSLIEVPDLIGALHQLLAQLPAGRVTTYGTLATALGNVTAARWVATYLLDPDGPPDLPRHRVVLRNGALVKSRVGDAHDQARMLADEGIEVRDRAVDLARYRFDEFASAQPLRLLQETQNRL